MKVENNDFFYKIINSNEELRFFDGIFIFYTIEFGSAFADKRVVIRVRNDRDAKERAKEKGHFNFNRIYKSNFDEIISWMKSHDSYFDEEAKIFKFYKL